MNFQCVLALSVNGSRQDGVKAFVKELEGRRNREKDAKCSDCGSGGCGGWVEAAPPPLPRIS